MRALGIRLAFVDNYQGRNTFATVFVVGLLLLFINKCSKYAKSGLMIVYGLLSNIFTNSGSLKLTLDAIRIMLQVQLCKLSLTSDLFLWFIEKFYREKKYFWGNNEQ